MMHKAWIAIRLFLRFARAVVVSGWETTLIILATRHPTRASTQPGFARLSFAPMSEVGATLLGAMVTLTPGTTTLDIDMETHMLIVHMLDTSSAAGLLEVNREEFEPLLCVLFPPREAA